MPHQIVLISSLGESPAVVTEAIDKLEHEEKLQFTQVVTIGTSKHDVRQSADILSNHIPTYYGGRITYVPIFITATDLSDERENLEYLTCVAHMLRTYRPFSDVYVSLAGGRKTMSALMALAVQIYGARLLCHVIHLLLEMDESLQQKMHVSQLRRYPAEHNTLLHPALEELVLVRLPVISLFPFLNDFLEALSGQELKTLDRSVRSLLEDSRLIEEASTGWRVTEVGKQLHAILADIESLPEPSTTAPLDKYVHIRDDHGKDKLLVLAERLRLFPYAERIVSTDWNAHHDRSRMTRTSYGRLLIETTDKQPDTLRITMDADRGYALHMYTNAKSSSQAERVKRELDAFLTNKG